MKKKLIVTLMTVILLLYTQGNLFAQESNADSKNYFKSILNTQNKEMHSNGLSIRTSEIIDTYLIASALNLEFNSPILLPNTETTPIYSSAKKYFSVYSDHDFIQECNQYIRGDDINGDAIGIILGYYGLDETEIVKQQVRLDRINSIYRQNVFNEDVTKFTGGVTRLTHDEAYENHL